MFVEIRPPTAHVPVRTADVDVHRVPDTASDQDKLPPSVTFPAICIIHAMQFEGIRLDMQLDRRVNWGFNPPRIRAMRPAR
jgi:hypothetical protein